MTSPLDLHVLAARMSLRIHGIDESAGGVDNLMLNSAIDKDRDYILAQLQRVQQDTREQAATRVEQIGRDRTIEVEQLSHEGRLDDAIKVQYMGDEDMRVASILRASIRHFPGRAKLWYKEESGEQVWIVPSRSTRKRGTMSKKDLSLNPQNISGDIWYYEENNGIDVLIHKLDGTHNIDIQFTIPWKMIRASLKRKDARRTNTKGNRK